ncbi:MAG: response regulator, partial [Planctomycetes bacterium]|nr:response regulator [Planctomycetota bacterium]
GFPVRSNAGSVYRVAGIAEDITERKRAEEALQRAHDELEQCVQVRTLDLTAANERLRREVADRNVAEEALRKAHDGLELRVQKRTADLTEVNGQLLQEIAERIRTERELQVAKEAAEEANRAKTEFLSRMSHEIRTPLTVILACAEMFAEGEMSGHGWSDCVETVKRNGRHLLGLVNNVLDVSKITTGKMEVESIDCDLTEMLNEVKSVATYEARAKGVEVRLDIDPHVPRWIVTDPTKLRQILLNLTGNAVKFTEQGTVHLSASLLAPNRRGGLGGASAADCAGIVRFAVQDTGIGIESDKLSAIFDAFSQADSSITRRYGGTGLGLTISKGMADLLGGTLGVQSELGRGSKFTLELPYQPAEKSAMHEPARPEGGRAGDARLSDVEILIADDCDDVRRVMEVLLSNAGARVTSVASGRAVVERAADNDYDVVLLDIHMPDLDGISAVTQMRRRGVRAPVLAVTADATADSRRRCLEAGFNEFMFKPFQSDELVSKIRSTLDQIAPDAGGSHPPSASFPERTQAQPDGFDSPPESDAPIRSTLAARSPELAQAAADFVYSMKLTMAQLDRALRARDFSELTEIAHRLKGSGGIIGFLSVSEAASGLEHAARATDTDKAAARIDALRSLSTRMLAGLDGN